MLYNLSMQLLSVLTQYGARAVARTFSYAYYGKKKVGERFRVKINFNGKEIMGFVTKVEVPDKTQDELEKELGYSIKEIRESDIIDEEPLINDELMELANRVADYYMAPLISVLQAMLPKTLSPKLSSLKGPKIAYEKWVKAIDSSEDDLTPKQIEMLRLIVSNDEILKKECGSPSILKTLEEKKKVIVFSKEKMRFVLPPEERENTHEMSDEQKGAYNTILSSPKDVVLLQGVTGSGKTEVYLRVSERYLEDGKTVLMLVPEINLTPQMVEYFSRRFGQKVAILHSELTPGERYDEYRRIAQGKAQIVVGARSAVFAPLKNIGLIILDEEHVESYKQDNSPYYHAREVAIMRGKISHAKVLLGSATPTLETKARAMRGVYGYAEMKNRVNKRPLPKTQIVDLCNRLNFDKSSEKLTKPVLQAIKERIDKKEQSLLLINRRGYWTAINCPQCGYIFSCPQCGGNLTYHIHDHMLKCHHCGEVQIHPDKCPSCGCTKLRRVGYGTERIVEELKEIIPNCKVARMDSDVSQVSKKMEETLKAFKNGEYDILVGTQMIAKGHDFPNVTLSSVVMADIGLSLPTYRAAERTFQLIAQAVGRSGRSTREGVAFIQTYNPHHYAITMGATQDYERFFIREMNERKITQYPPYVYLILLEFSAVNEEKCVNAAYDIKRALEDKNIESLSVVGPITPFYSMVGGKHKRVVLLKMKKRDAVVEELKALLSSPLSSGSVDISVNVDPLDY